MAGSPSTATGASCRCSATWCSRSRRTRSSTEYGPDRRPEACASNELDEGALARWSDLQGRRTGAHRARVPAGSLRAAPLGPDAVFPREQPARHRLPAHLRTSRTRFGTAVNVHMMVFGNTGDRWRRVSASHATRPPSARVLGEFLRQTPRERTWVAGIRTPRPMPNWRVMPARTTNSDPSRRAWSATTRTSRTRSSPSRTTSCTAADPERQAHGYAASSSPPTSSRNPRHAAGSAAPRRAHLPVAGAAPMFDPADGRRCRWRARACRRRLARRPDRRVQRRAGGRVDQPGAVRCSGRKERLR